MFSFRIDDVLFPIGHGHFVFSTFYLFLVTVYPVTCGLLVACRVCWVGVVFLGRDFVFLGRVLCLRI